MSKICSLRGISAPQLTPFREDGSINYGEYTRLTQFITDAGVHGVFVCGTTGEFVNLTLEERKRLLTAAVEGAGPESCILFNTTAMNLADMKELFDWARHEGAHAASVTAPYYHSYDAETLTAYFRKAAELAEGMPLYLYNMPGMTHNPITPKVVQEVCDTCPNVAGLKDSSMDFLTFQEFQSLELPEGFELITGNDAQVLPVLQSGGDGAIIAMASVFPKQCQQLWDCYYAGELEQARRIQRMLLKLRGLVRSVMPVMAHKKMLELQGFHMGPARFPFRDLSGEESRTIEEGLEKLLGQVG